jgi:hypothetical protein
MPKPGLTGSGKHEGFDLARFEQTNYHLPSLEGRRDDDDFVRLLEAREMICPYRPVKPSGRHEKSTGRIRERVRAQDRVPTLNHRRKHAISAVRKASVHRDTRLRDTHFKEREVGQAGRMWCCVYTSP